MSKVFVECQWLILNFDEEDLREILRLADVLECELWINEDRLFVDGYQWIVLCISADAEDIVTLFRQAIQRYAQFSDCHVLNQPPSHLTSLSESLRTQFAVTDNLIYLLQTAARHNQRVRNHLPVWATGLWITNPHVEIAHLEAVVQMAQDNEIAIFYQIKRLMRPEIQFYFKLNRIYDFHLRMNEIKTLMKLKRWTVIFEAEVYAMLEKHPRLTRSTLPTFFNAAQGHV